ncbi:hypothetical protein SAMN05444340_1121, partial [Citreimonas salinaria]
EDEQIGTVTADGAYDTRRCHKAITDRQGTAIRKRWTGYHARSRIEAKMRCLKSFGDRIMARDPDRQTAETHIRIALMNRFTALGTADIVRAA